MNIKKPKINFKDRRGSIRDIFYKKNINHVAIIRSKAGVRRGDHYHKKTTSSTAAGSKDYLAHLLGQYRWLVIRLKRPLILKSAWSGHESMNGPILKESLPGFCPAIVSLN